VRGEGGVFGVLKQSPGQGKKRHKKSASSSIQGLSWKGQRLTGCFDTSSTYKCARDGRPAIPVATGATPTC
jgi:hypothetical protein